MGTYYGTYQTDLGRDIYATRVFTRFRVAESLSPTLREVDLLPAVFVSAMNAPDGPCVLPVEPRRALLYLSDVLQFELPIPFRGGTPEYQQMLAEIEGFPNVARYEVLPERIAPYQCLVQLGAL